MLFSWDAVGLDAGQDPLPGWAVLPENRQGASEDPVPAEFGSA
jgi:hypothetical protein